MRSEILKLPFVRSLDKKVLESNSLRPVINFSIEGVEEALIAMGHKPKKADLRRRVYEAGLRDESQFIRFRLIIGPQVRSLYLERMTEKGYERAKMVNGQSVPLIIYGRVRKSTWKGFRSMNSQTALTGASELVERTREILDRNCPNLVGVQFSQKNYIKVLL